MNFFSISPLRLISYRFLTAFQLRKMTSVSKTIPERYEVPINTYYLSFVGWIWFDYFRKQFQRWILSKRINLRYDQVINVANPWKTFFVICRCWMFRWPNNKNWGISVVSVNKSNVVLMHDNTLNASENFSRSHSNIFSFRDFIFDSSWNKSIKLMLFMWLELKGKDRHVHLPNRS